MVRMDDAEVARLRDIERRYNELVMMLDDPVKVALRQLRLACRARDTRNTTESPAQNLSLTG